MRVAEAVDRLLTEAEAVRGQSAHFKEQKELEAAAAYLQIEYGLRLVAHVFDALHDEDGFEDEDE